MSEQPGEKPDPPGSRAEGFEEQLFEVPADVKELLDRLPPEKQEIWKRMIRGWLEPTVRLAAMRAQVNSPEEIPAYHVPSAEGVAVYQGMFGPNGELSPMDKKLLKRLLTSATDTGPAK